ncbi:hypothetical protein VPNG_07123 [Cytospora leucostoma]|uniref:Carbonic anhydrase n=1 Tax=Cytospora leucostoma TaxID=1230097 RepID=A0A423WVM9_9PEZI|nr:hypothetical protein VPNG_07123 [Cytospora leucostoma]
MSSSYPDPINQWLEGNETYANETFPSLPEPWHMSEQRGVSLKSGDLSFVLTCLDPRCIPENFFGTDIHSGVFRNAGGRVIEDVIRSFTVLRVLAGLKNVAIVHHTGTYSSCRFITGVVTPALLLLLFVRQADMGATLYSDCGVMHVSSKEIIDTIASVGPEAKRQAEKLEYQLFTCEGLDESVKEDVRALRSAETLAGINVYGFKLDTHTGRVERVEV